MRALAVLAVLLVLWGTVTLFRGGLGETTGTLRVPAFTAAEVDRIDIVGADTVRLERAADGWRVNGAAADAAEVRKLLDALADSAMTSELVARSVGSHASLGVDSAGRRLALRAGGELLVDLVVGNRGGGFASVYARLADQNDVYRLRSPLGGLVDRDANAWRSRRIAAIAADSVARIVIQRGRSATQLVRDGDRWLVDAAPADTAALRRLLGALADITAIGFATATELDSLDFARPDRRLTVLSPAADTLLDLLVDSTSAGFRVRTAAQPDVFQVDFWRVNELTPPVESLRPSGS
jgi:hypothetical protein